MDDERRLKRLELSSEIIVGYGDITFSMNRETFTYEKMDLRIANELERRKRRLLKRFYFETHAPWNHQTRTCLSCGKSEIEIMLNKDICNVNARTETGT